MGSNIPRYQNVEAILRGEITDLPPNTLLPTELQYAKRFDVSRVTIRRAMEMLEKSGMISRSRGRGTIVCPPKVTRRFSPLYSFDQDFNDQGIEVETQILDYQENVVPPEWIRTRLRLKPAVVTSLLSLLRLVDDRIISHDVRYYPPGTSKLLKNHLDKGLEISEFLARLISMRNAVDWDSEIVSSYSDIAKALGIATGSLVVENSFVYFTERGKAIEAGAMSYRIDRCKFKYEGKFSACPSNE
ncbi:MAG: GntR family transcriptional regulator [bacterium]|nr:GntR family transcriptional regulator [bacterium]